MSNRPGVLRGTSICRHLLANSIILPSCFLNDAIRDFDMVESACFHRTPFNHECYKFRERFLGRRKKKKSNLPSDRQFQNVCDVDSQSRHALDLLRVLILNPSNPTSHPRTPTSNESNPSRPVGSNQLDPTGIIPRKPEPPPPKTP